jgi:hypothetical protein
MKYPDKNLTIKHIYREFSKEYKDLCDKYEIDYKLYKKVCISFNKKVIREIIFNGYTFNFGSLLGHLCIRTNKTPIKNPKIDFYKTKKLGFKVFHLNEHTNYKYYFTYWRKGRTMNIKCYRFYFNTKNKNLMVNAIKNKMIKTL